MNVEKLHEILESDFYTGVPDSQLRPLCDYLMDKYGTDKRHHIIAANEGNSAAIAAGVHMATGRVPVVYMQNSGEGNIVNPLSSLLNEKVYGIPVIFIIGWRGEPGVHDEPQHIFQGEVTLKLLDDMDVAYTVISKETTSEEFVREYDKLKQFLDSGKCIAIVVKKDALKYEKKVVYSNRYTLLREEAINSIVKHSGEDILISSTGKISRELFEIREKKNQGHKYDFLTVGSMGHCSSIALGVAINKADSRVWCIDGDGALLMHMGAMAIIGNLKPHNLIHVVINNEAHETVGGMPTAASTADFTKIAKACGYENVVSVSDKPSLESALEKIKSTWSLSLIEIKCAIGSRKDLGRPSRTPYDNKIAFMDYLKSVD